MKAKKQRDPRVLSAGGAEATGAEPLTRRDAGVAGRNWREHNSPIPRPAISAAEAGVARRRRSPCGPIHLEDARRRSRCEVTHARAAAAVGVGRSRQERISSARRSRRRCRYHAGESAPARGDALAQRRLAAATKRRTCIAEPDKFLHRCARPRRGAGRRRTRRPEEFHGPTREELRATARAEPRSSIGSRLRHRWAAPAKTKLDYQ